MVTHVFGSLKDLFASLQVWVLGEKDNADFAEIAAA
jgi:hypothetical protein